MKDRVNNVIRPKSDSVYSASYLLSLLEIVHSDPTEVPNIQTQVELQDLDFLVNVTTHRVGTLKIKSALPGSEPLSIQIISQQHPSAQNSYAEVDLQVMQAGVLFYPKVFIRDMFGNKVIKATDDVETLGLTATIYKEEAGRDPVIVKSWFALT